MFVYAVGRRHPYRDPCRAIVARAADGQLRGEASVDLVQEFLHSGCASLATERTPRETRVTSRRCAGCTI